MSLGHINIQDNQQQQQQRQRQEEQNKFLDVLPLEEQQQQQQRPTLYRDDVADRKSLQWGVLTEDTAKLGEKISKASTDAELEYNRRIDDAKKLTKKATAYTLETYDIVNSTQLKLPKNVGQNQHEKDNYLARMLFAVENFQFSPVMLQSANIRANLAEYVTLVRYWEALEAYMSDAAAADDLHVSGTMTERMSALRPLMSVFIDRVNIYLNNNRIDINGKVLKKNARFKKNLSAEQVKDFTRRAYANQKRRKEYKMDLDAQYIGEETLNGVLSEQQQESPKKEELNVLPAFVEMNTTQRVRNLPKLRYLVRSLNDRIGQTEGAIEDVRRKMNPEGKLPEEDQRKLTNLEENLHFLKQSLFEAKCTIKMGEAEARYLLASKQGNATDEMKAELEELFADYRKIYERQFKRQFSNITFRTTSNAQAATLTHAEALTSQSDSDNMQFKLDVKKLNSSMRRQFRTEDNNPIGNDGAHLINPSDAQAEAMEEAFAAVNEWCAATHYKEGPEAESKLFKDALNAVNALKELISGNNLINDLHKKLHELADGKLDVDFASIPDELKKDCFDQRPKDGAFSWGSGGIKNFFTNNWLFRTYKKLSNDTPLFAHEPTVNDLRQTKVCNCWMIAATTSIINTNPEIIKNAIKDNGDGSCTVRLFKRDNGFVKPMYVRVSKEIPKMRTGGDLLSTGALWMQMLEKAAAFLGRDGEEGYNSLWYGDVGEWVLALTGKEADIVRTDALGMTNVIPGEGLEQENNLFEAICRSREDKSIFTAGTGPHPEVGLFPNHAYSILGGRIVGGQRYVVLRDPYANMGLKYDTLGKKTATGNIVDSEPDATYGQFTIRFEEFLRNMSRIYKTDANNLNLNENPLEAKRRLDAHNARRAEILGRNNNQNQDDQNPDGFEVLS